MARARRSPWPTTASAPGPDAMAPSSWRSQQLLQVQHEQDERGHGQVGRRDPLGRGDEAPGYSPANEQRDPQHHVHQPGKHADSRQPGSAPQPRVSRPEGTRGAALFSGPSDQRLDWATYGPTATGRKSSPSVKRSTGS